MAVAQLDTKPIEVSQNYRGPDGSIELEGVCKIEEDSVRCWKADGKPHDELKSRVLSHVEREGRNFIAHFGKKTRYAVFRVSGTADPYGTQFEGSTWELGRPSSDRSFVVPLVASLEQRKATVDVSIRVSGGTSDPLLIRDGATLTHHGVKLRIVKVAASELDPAVFGTDVLSRWLVYYSVEGGLLNAASWRAYDHDDVLISAVNLEGKPVKVDPAVLLQVDTMNQNASIPKPNVRRAQINVEPYVLPVGAAQNLVVINIDPKHIKHVTLYSTNSRKITITDIPLEPSR